MEIMSKAKEIKISDDTFLKICRELKAEIKDAKKNFEKLNELDYEYNKKVVYVEKIVEMIDLYMTKHVTKKEAKNIMVLYFGDPMITIELLLSALLNCQTINLVIDDMCLGINKLIVELYKNVLRDFKIFDIVSFNNYDSEEELKLKTDGLDKIYFLGNKNLYNVCKKMPNNNFEYVPFNSVDIYCENEEFYDLSKEIFNYCFENGIEAQIFEDMTFDEIVEGLNDFSEKYCSVILTKNKEYATRFKKEVKSKFVYVNENPFTNEFMKLPNIF